MRSVFALVATVTFGAQASPDALKQFEEIVEQCRRSYAAPTVRVFFAAANNKWIKRMETPESFRYDARKTESLVSPLIGYIEASTVGAVTVSDTEEAAANSSPNLAGKASRSMIKYNYAYRDGVWLFVDATETITWRENPGNAFREPISYPKTKAALTKEAAPWAICIRS